MAYTYTIVYTIAQQSDAFKYLQRLFLAKLSEYNLLPGNTKDEIMSKTTPAGIADYFL